MNKFFWLWKIALPFFEAPGGTSGGGSNEPTVEQLQQQVRETEAKYNLLNSKVEKGELVEPAKFLEAKTKAGEIYTKDRYVGLQQTFQAEQESHKTTKGTLAALSASELDWKTKFSNLEQEKKVLETGLESKDTEIDKLTRKGKRSAIIMEKYPQLAAFEAKGLLPDGEETELEKLFGTFAEQLGVVEKDATKQFVSGGGKPTPPGKKETEAPAPDSPRGLLKLAHAALASGDKVGYDKYYDEYLAALTKEAVK